jgi:hypothetical protein
MKTLLSSTAALAVLLFTPSCATTNGPISPDVVEANVFDAVRIGTKATLIYKPESREAFEKAFVSLNIAVNNGKITGGTLAEILQAMQIKSLSGDRGAIVMEGGIFLVNLVVGTRLDLTKNEYVYAAAVGARDGLAAALGEPPMPSSSANQETDLARVSMDSSWGISLSVRRTALLER